MSKYVKKWGGKFLLFGMTTDEVDELARQGYDPQSYYHSNVELKNTLDMIASGYFCPDEPKRYQEAVDALLKHGDHYMLLADYASYVDCQDKVSELYRDQRSGQNASFLTLPAWASFLVTELLANMRNISGMSRQ